MRGVTTTMIAVALLGLATAATPAAAYAAGYDGDWTVVVTTEHGTCERTSSYDVKVSHGNIIYTSHTALSMYGTVSPQGAVSVLISRFDEGARGTGRLTQHGGSGGWHGAGKDGACSGHWEASRR